MTVTPAAEEFAARLGAAGTGRDAAVVDGIIAEIAAGGLPMALAVLAVQTRNLVWMLKLQHGEEAARKLFRDDGVAGGRGVR